MDSNKQIESLVSDILEDSDELYHYGVLGMKWGVRKDGLKNAGRRLKNRVKDTVFNTMHNKKPKTVDVGGEEINVYSMRNGVMQSVAGTPVDILKKVNEKEDFVKADKEYQNAYDKLIKDRRAGKISKVKERRILNKIERDHDSKVMLKWSMISKLKDHLKDSPTRTITDKDYDRIKKEAVKEMQNEKKSDIDSKLMYFSEKHPEYKNLPSDIQKKVVDDYYYFRAERDEGLTISQLVKEVTEENSKNVKHSDSYSDELYHYGVLGMKWGVRKDDIKNAGRRLRSAAGAVGRGSVRAVKAVGRGSVGAVKAVGRGTVAVGKGTVAAGSAVRRWKNRRAINSMNPERLAKRYNKMNNEELAILADRLTLRNHAMNELRNNNNYAKSVGNGKSFVKDVLSTAGKQVATAVVVTAISSAIAGVNPFKGVRNQYRSEALKNQNAYDQNKITSLERQDTLNKWSRNNERNHILSNAEWESKFTKAVSEAQDNMSKIDSFEKLKDIKLEKDINVMALQSKKAEAELEKLKHSYSVNDELYHYGVLGMKWGVRKDQKIVDRLSSKRGKISKKLDKRRNSSKNEKLDAKSKKLEKQKLAIDKEIDDIISRTNKNMVITSEEYKYLTENPWTKQVFDDLKGMGFKPYATERDRLGRITKFELKTKRPEIVRHSDELYKKEISFQCQNNL